MHHKALSLQKVIALKSYNLYLFGVIRIYLKSRAWVSHSSLGVQSLMVGMMVFRNIYVEPMGNAEEAEEYYPCIFPLGLI